MKHALDIEASDMELIKTAPEKKLNLELRCSYKTKRKKEWGEKNQMVSNLRHLSDFQRNLTQDQSPLAETASRNPCKTLEISTT
jgi:hypothetical protein